MKTIYTEVYFDDYTSILTDEGISTRILQIEHALNKSLYQAYLVRSSGALQYSSYRPEVMIGIDSNLF